MEDFSIILIVLIIVPFLLFFIRITIICWKNSELSRQIKLLEQQQAARQQAENAYVSTISDNINSNCNNSTGTLGKDFDLPPAYEDVVQSYILTKQQQYSENTPAECGTGITATTSTNAISTITIATEISKSNYASAVSINQSTNSPQ